MTTTKLTAAIISLFILSSCNSTHLIYVQETTLGLNVAIGTEGTEKVSFGYDRDALAVVPTTGSKTDNEAMSLLSINKAKVSGLSDIEISEFVATGIPATKLAQDAAAITDLRNKIYGEGR